MAVEAVVLGSFERASVEALEVEGSSEEPSAEEPRVEMAVDLQIPSAEEP